MRVLLTGAGGQVGTEMASELAGRAEVASFERAGLDLADPDAIVAKVRDVRPQVIVNAGAYTAVDRAEEELGAARAVNARAPGILAEEARRLGALLVHFSTDYVFDGTKPAPYVEDDQTAPANRYGLSKLEGEQAVAATGAGALVLRTSWVYGPHGKNFMLTMLRLGATRPELRVVNDQRGSPTSSRQIARGVVRMLAGGDPARVPDPASVAAAAERRGLYHYTAAGATTWFDFARAIFALRARQPGAAFDAPRVIAIPSSEFPTPARRPANSVLSNARFEAAFGFTLPAWEQGLEEALSALPG
jgi:dTDP-4-dehydrorhamnose reductase